MLRHSRSRTSTIGVILLGLLCLVSWLAPATAVAATFYVNDTGNEPNANPGNGLAETLQGLTTIRAALEEANALGGTHTIVLEANTTYTFDEVVNVWFGPNAWPAVAAEVTVEGNGAVVERDGNAPHMRLVYVSSDAAETPPEGSLTLRDLTVRDFYARGGRGGDGQFGGGGGAGLGGAIYNGGTLIVERCTFFGNTARGGHGGDTITEDSAAGGGGGGLGGDGATARVAGNDAGGGGGGGGSMGATGGDGGNNYMSGGGGGAGLEGPGGSAQGGNYGSANSSGGGGGGGRTGAGGSGNGGDGDSLGGGGAGEGSNDPNGPGTGDGTNTIGGQGGTGAVNASANSGEAGSANGGGGGGGGSFSGVQSSANRSAGDGGDGGDYGGGGGGGGAAQFDAMGGVTSGGSGGAGGFGSGGGGGGGGMRSTQFYTNVHGQGGHGGDGGIGGGGGGGGRGNGVYESRGGSGGHGGFGGGGGAAGHGSANSPAGGDGGFGAGGGAGFTAGQGGYGGGDGRPGGSHGPGGGGAGMGGAIFSTGELVLVNVTFHGNEALGGDAGNWGTQAVSPTQADPGDGLGGAIFILDGTLTVMHATLADNTATPGSGPGTASTAASSEGANVYVYEGQGSTVIVEIDNTILWGTDGGLSIFGDGGAYDGENNIAESYQGTPGLLIASTSDPQLGPLQNNGGPTYTRALPPGSPAIDGGIELATTPATDQRGVPRIFDGNNSGTARPDVGAYEYYLNQPPTLALPDASELASNHRIHFDAGTPREIDVDDPDAGLAEVELQMSVQTGTLTLATTAGLTLLTGTGTDDSEIVAQGTLEDLRAALDGMTYRFLVADDDELSVTLDDLGNTGTGGPQQASAVRPLTFVANLAPSIEAPESLFIDELEGAYEVTFRDDEPDEPSIVIDDPDSAPEHELAVTLVLDAETGDEDPLASTLTLATTDDLTLPEGSTGANLELFGTAAAINEALDGLHLLYAEDDPAGLTLAITVDDQNQGPDGSATAEHSIALERPGDNPDSESGGCHLGTAQGALAPVFLALLLLLAALTRRHPPQATRT